VTVDPSPAKGALWPRFAVVDVETSGLSPRVHRILQVAVVTVGADGTVTDRWSSYVRPRWPRIARTGPVEIHGIRRRHLVGAPPLDDVLVELRARTSGAILVAHNLEFDWAFLQRAARRRKLQLSPEGRLCTLELARSIPLADGEERRSNRLGDLCGRYGVDLERAHDALADAEATAALIPHLLRGAGVASAGGLDQFVAR
jgi:DNA polymerase III subunit epsilon